MSGLPSAGEPESVHAGTIVDSICDRFEAAWRAGKDPRAEEFLSAVSASLAPRLLEELLAVEVSLRKERHDMPTREELLGRFSSYAAVVDRVLVRFEGISGETIVTPPPSMRSTSNQQTQPRTPQPRPAESMPSAADRYVIQTTLGRGAFGAVYCARDLELQRDVALKLPHRRHLANDCDAEAYLYEARVLARLDHPNIVPVYDVGKDAAGNMFVVSKLVHGTDLRRRMEEGRLSYREAAELIATVAEALHYAHDEGLVHRDVKPANILLGAQGRPYVADFGLAVSIEAAASSTEIAGTLAYMSPEQASGQGDHIDRRSDVFSLGVVLYELLTGERPFRGETAEELIASIREANVPTPRRAERSIPRPLAKICVKALARDPDDRYASAQDMADDLKRYLEESVENPLTRALAFAAPLLLVSWTSLALAYYGPWTTDAWLLRFDRLGNDAWPLGTGFGIEAFRSLLFLSIIVFVAGARFHREAWSLANLKRHAWDVNIMRVLFLGVAAYFIYTEGSRFLLVERQPAELAQWAKEHGLQTTAAKEWYPFAVYLPYSLVNYVMGVGLLFVLAVFALTRDYLRLRHARRTLNNRISRAKVSEHQVRLAFAGFRDTCYTRCARYLDVLGIVALSVHFEYWFGRFTLTEEAYNTLFFGRLLVTSAALCLLCIGYFYSNGLQQTHRVLASKDCPQLTVWHANHSPWQFIKSLFLGNMSGLLLLSLLIPLLDNRLNG